MIKADISNVWGSVEFGDLMAIEKEVSSAHACLDDGSGAGGAHLGWMALPTREASTELSRIQETAQALRRDSNVLVVVGVGGSCLGSQAAIELLQGQQRNLRI